MLLNGRALVWALLFASALATSEAAAASSALTGKMSVYNYLLAGNWSCSASGSGYTAAYSASLETRCTVAYTWRKDPRMRTSAITKRRTGSGR